MPEPGTVAVELRLRLPADYDFGWVIGFLAARAVPALEAVSASTGELARVVRVGAGLAVLQVRAGPPGGRPRWLDVRADLSAAPADRAPTVVRLVSRMFDLDTDLGPFLELARRDPLLRPLVARAPGLRLPQVPEPFEGAVRAILGQQVSVAAARTMVDRLVRLLGGPVAGGRHAFPLAETVAAAGPKQLATIGLTRAKSTALAGLAAAVLAGTIDWERLRAAPPEEAQAALLALPGVGPWTASYIRMRALGDRDAFPASDLGIVKALGALWQRSASGRARRPPEARDIAAAAAAWRPWRAYAALHLWHSLVAPTAP
ncbi:MAG TPA: AlkA N-terminal domain-containing protein [Thermoanaerobaculia bacterium]|nr:AlkA N-terminal domain-containing protein [Thermoanaerobaculia bacterium]